MLNNDNETKLLGFIIAGITSIVYGLKVWDDLSHQQCDENGECKPQRNKMSILRNVVYSAFGSGLVCLLVYNGIIYYTDLPDNFALLLGALCGYTGADAFKDILLRFIENKFNSKGKDNG